MNNSTEKLNEALKMLRQGETAEKISAEFANEAQELSPLLKISQSLLALPKNPVPTPLMRHKYATAKAKTFWFAWTNITRLATVSTAVMLLISAFAVTGYAAWSSTPGQTLFPVKKLAEQSRLILAYNQNQKANLQVEITKKRLDEARTIFQDPSSNIDQEKAALTELSDQTRNAIEVVNNITASNPKAGNNHPLVSSLETITQQQQTLLKDIKPSSEIKEAAGSAILALTENAAKISEIKQSIAIAANDQTLTKLNGDPNAVAVFGEISEITKEKIVVENTTFLFGSQTVIKNSEGKILNQESLAIKTKVNVVGTRDKTSIVAKDILVSATAAQPEVKSASTDNSKSVENKNAASSTTTTSIKEADMKEPLNNPNQALGSYIFEDPSPQFVK